MAKRICISAVLLLIAVGITAGFGYQAEVSRQNLRRAEAHYAAHGMAPSLRVELSSQEAHS